MANLVTYGLGGYCENCNQSHDHPLHNIISVEEVPNPEPTPDDLARASAVAKLMGLGLTEAEALALIGAV